jgi:hypothetical protein
MIPGKIFATGLTIDNYTGINMSDTDRVLRWVAKRGDVDDWAIYINFAEDNTVLNVERYGDKVKLPDHIKRIIPCDDEAFARYRY